MQDQKTKVRSQVEDDESATPDALLGHDKASVMSLDTVWGNIEQLHKLDSVSVGSRLAWRSLVGYWRQLALLCSRAGESPQANTSNQFSPNHESRESMEEPSSAPCRFFAETHQLISLARCGGQVLVLAQRDNYHDNNDQNDLDRNAAMACVGHCETVLSCLGKAMTDDSCILLETFLQATQPSRDRSGAHGNDNSWSVHSGPGFTRLTQLASFERLFKAKAEKILEAHCERRAEDEQRPAVPLALWNTALQHVLSSLDISVLFPNKEYSRQTAKNTNRDNREEQGATMGAFGAVELLLAVLTHWLCAPGHSLANAGEKAVPNGHAFLPLPQTLCRALHTNMAQFVLVCARFDVEVCGWTSDTIRSLSSRALLAAVTAIADTPPSSTISPASLHSLPTGWIEQLGICAPLLAALRSHMRAGPGGTAWKERPAACFEVGWVLQRLEAASVREHVPALLPLILPLVDDYETPNKVLGLRYLSAVVSVLMKADLQRHGLLVLHALEACLTFRELELVQLAFPLLAEVLIIMCPACPWGPPLPLSNPEAALAHKQWLQAFDKVLREVEYLAAAPTEKNLPITKIVFYEASRLFLLLGAGLVCMLQRVLDAVLTACSCHHAPSRKAAALLLATAMQSCRQRIPFHRHKIFEALMEIYVVHSSCAETRSWVTALTIELGRIVGPAFLNDDGLLTVIRGLPEFDHLCTGVFAAFK